MLPFASATELAGRIPEENEQGTEALWQKEKTYIFLSVVIDSLQNLILFSLETTKIVQGLAHFVKRRIPEENGEGTARSMLKLGEPKVRRNGF